MGTAAEGPSSPQSHQHLSIRNEIPNSPNQLLGSLEKSLDDLEIKHESHHDSGQNKFGQDNILYWGAPSPSNVGSRVILNNGSNDVNSFQNQRGERNKSHDGAMLSNAGPFTGQRKRGESIDLFLSTSPSQLDSGFLKFRNDGNKQLSPPISLDNTQTNAPLGFHTVNAIGPPPGVNQGPLSAKNTDTRNNFKQIRDSSRSPSCSVTGTTISSRSASPSYSGFPDGCRRVGVPVIAPSSDGSFGLLQTQNIQYSRDYTRRNDAEYHYGEDVLSVSNASVSSEHLQALNRAPSTFDNYKEGEFNAGPYIDTEIDNGSHPSVASHQDQLVREQSSLHFHHQRRDDHGNKRINNNKNNLFSSQNHSQHFVGPESKPQQLFYVAVPTQNGSQVLQPIQMVQLPGQPNAYVLPMSSQTHNVSFHGSSQPMHSTSYGTVNRVIHETSQEVGSSLSDIEKMHGQKKRNHRNPMRQPPHYSQIYRGRKRNEIATHGPLPNRKYNFSHNIGSLHSIDPRNKTISKQHIDRGTSNNLDPIIRNEYGKNTFHNQQVNCNMVANQDFNQTVIHDCNNHWNSDTSLNEKSDFVASLYASQQRPPLQDLLGHVHRLSRDQVGCRLLQQSLDEEEGPKAATLILNEGLAFWGETMVDPFGNYLFQKILEKVTAEERILLVKSVSTRLVNASLNLHGTRSVQKVVELCAIDEANTPGRVANETETAANILSHALAPAAARLCIDSHGNHVIQRILLKLPYKYSHFVFDAVANSVGDVARHRHGCCVIQRCLDSSPSVARTNLVRRIVEKSLELMQDAYGNYVVQYVLDVCSDQDVHSVCESVIGKVKHLAIQKFSSNVMEKCLDRCTDRIREIYLMELSNPERIKELMLDPFGNYVIQRAISVATHAQAMKLVDAMRPHLANGNDGGISNTPGGRRVIAKISRRFPNLNLDEVVLTVDKERRHQDSIHQSKSEENSYMRRRGSALSAQSITKRTSENHKSFSHDQFSIARNRSYQ